MACCLLPLKFLLPFFVYYNVLIGSGHNRISLSFLAITFGFLFLDLKNIDHQSVSNANISLEL